MICERIFLWVLLDYKSKVLQKVQKERKINQKPNKKRVATLIIINSYLYKYITKPIKALIAIKVSTFVAFSLYLPP